ncbi:hypothetical protein ABI59_11035 [Acidobacteria bacterium Mor1]|nr:hypothetical protein ABI59_11035 [Acidobacteria bacterium Mor1]
MRVLGADLQRGDAAGQLDVSTLVMLDDEGRCVSIRHPQNLLEVAAFVGELSTDEPFLLGVNLPVVMPAKAARNRPVENLIKRRLGHKLPAGGRGALGVTGIGGEALIAGLSAAGHPCLPYPDRDRRQSGIAEIHPALCARALFWERSTGSQAGTQLEREERFRAWTATEYRRRSAGKRAGWADRAVALDRALLTLSPAADGDEVAPGGYDFAPVRTTLAQAGDDETVEKAGSLFDALLIAGTARRYLRSPEACVFLGDREQGYVIMPADGSVRRLALRDAKPSRPRLFPQTSLEDRLKGDAQLRPLDLLAVEGRPRRVEASFDKQPVYEFDNLDEMLWWKHCRHLSGPTLPIEGLQELLVLLQTNDDLLTAATAGNSSQPLRLARSRHRTLSFRFDPPSIWRQRLPTRDGRTYPFRILRAVYETE